MDLPRQFTIRESSHRVRNPIDEAKLATFGAALRLPPGSSVLDLACGSGELLCTWARDHGCTGLGVDISTVFLASARARAEELGVASQVSFVHADARGYVASAPVDVAACVGATWIGDGVEGTVSLLRQSLRPGGVMVVGEPYWRLPPPDQATIEGCDALHSETFTSLPELVERFGALGCDVVEMVLADQDSWDRFEGPKWLNLRRFLDANPDDDLADEFRAELRTAALNHVRYRREYLGWGVFALMDR